MAVKTQTKEVQTVLEGFGTACLIAAGTFIANPATSMHGIGVGLLGLIAYYFKYKVRE